ncbi:MULTISPECIES: molybdopterin-dependent oxidoreductase [unclassified Halomonas]|uniref:molybdopterin-dependent oxidoreductase n=1 Tax=unclassified Halomonas TaxID=2609666 RepID=UPI0020768EF1|nr:MULTISPECIES: molybdopterin-dependent oxidoreductase [unclassified Halomonas]
MRYPIALAPALLLLSLSAAGENLEPPQGPVLLVVSGHLDNTNVGDEAHFDRAMLEALEQHETHTHTPWHDGAVNFSGPLGRALLEAVGSDSDQVRVTALNDYAATIPVSDFYQYDLIFAMRADGEPLRVRDQGPLFVIYPFDDDPDLLNEITLNRSVWQVNRLNIE